MKTNGDKIVCSRCSTVIRNEHHLALDEHRVIHHPFFDSKERNQYMFCCWECLTVFVAQKNGRPMVVYEVADRELREWLANHW